MEMDIPLPEELEWLESNALTPEDAAAPEEDFLDEDDELLELCKAIPDDNGDVGPASKIQKRQRGEGGGGPGAFFQELESVGKRSKQSNIAADRVVEEEDEDWLRYSPARNGAGIEGDDEVGSGDGSVEVDVEERIVCRFASEIDGDCIPVTGPGGDRVYAKMEPVVVDVGPPRSRTFERPEKGLLLESINVIMERVEEEALGKVLHESFGSPSDATASTKLMVNEQLWVEKYAPNSFTELLSDEQTNREVLLWLKQWDSCVFGSHIRATTDDVLYALKRHSSLAQAQYRRFSDNMSYNKNKGVHFENHKFNQSNMLDKQNISLQESLESWTGNSTVTSPPEYKVLLLCGPPGLGKTTLAHIAAKHCGYRVVEINASDERSSSTIESKILDVVQMNSVMTDSKPKCLIIDEIDGALGEGKGAVEVILKMVLAEKNSSHENNHLVGPSGKASKKGRKSAKLSRPVICICNDLYAPALRPLRQVSKVHVFVQPTTYRVVNRLKHICRMEGFKTSSIALTALAEYTECDIRSCLNTLQFLHKKKEPLNFLEVDAQVVGRKDMSRTAFDVWKEIFQKKKPKREKKSNNKLGTTGDFEFVYSLVSNRGEYELTMDGIYENFLHLSYHDPFMRKSASCLDVLGTSDSLLWYTMRTQQMSLNAYQPFVAISMRNLIAQVNRPNIEWPKSIQRFRMMAMEKKEQLKLWHNKLSPSIARHLSIESFVEDVVTPLLHILSPPTLRPVALHLLSERERDDLSQLVDTMVSYSLTYKSTSERMPKYTKHGENFNVQLLYLEPPIDNFVSFKDYQPGHYGLSMAIKQVLVHEVEKYRILCESTGRSSNQNNGSSDKSQTSSSGTTGIFSEKTNKVAPSAGEKMLSENKLTSDANRNSAAVGIKLKAPANSTKSSGRSNFFDRFRKQKDTGSPEISKPATMERDLRPLLFKYNEGFTNAVKRPVRMRELLF